MTDAIKAAANQGKDSLPSLVESAQVEGATVDAWKALHQKQREVYTAQNGDLQTGKEKLEESQTKRSDAEERSKKAAEKAAELRAAIDKKKQETSASASTEAQKDPFATFVSFLKERGALHSAVILRLEAWRKAGQYTSEALRNAPLSTVFEYLDDWPSFEENTAASLKKLEETAEKLREMGADVCDVNDLTSDFNALKAVFDDHGTKLLREQARRQDYDQSVEKLMTSQSQLLHWCRQQRAALESQKEPDHVQEFCASLQNNIGVMESNFLVIMEMAEQIVPNPSVEKALIEVAEVWMALEVFAYEKLRSTLVELHQKSGLEGECKLWAEYSLRFKKFLESAEALLEMPSDPESKAVTKPVLDNCKQLLLDHDLHLIIAEHLSDFALREECVKDHYSAIRRTIFSKLTLLTQSFVGHQGYGRKTEYTDRLAELSDWVDCKSQNNAWKDLLARVEKMRRLVEENEVTSTEISSPSA